jgi:hypothetical protein
LSLAAAAVTSVLAGMAVRSGVFSEQELKTKSAAAVSEMAKSDFILYGTIIQYQKY